MKKLLLPLALAISAVVASFSSVAGITPDDSLKIVIIRHAEKPASGDNLSCQGENRALLLPAVLHRKFNRPDHTYVPSMALGKSMAHARMLQTVIPFAIKYGLVVNSEFKENDYSAIADHLLRKSGTVLMVWEHNAIPPLAAALGVVDPPPWKNKDFDSIWTITFAAGKASLSIDSERLSPSPNCSF